VPEKTQLQYVPQPEQPAPAAGRQGAPHRSIFEFQRIAPLRQ